MKVEVGDLILSQLAQAALDPRRDRKGRRYVEPAARRMLAGLPVTKADLVRMDHAQARRDRRNARRRAALADPERKPEMD